MTSFRKLLALCVVFFCHSLLAQKVDIDKTRFSYNKTIPPAEPLNPEVYFFEVKVNNHGTVRPYFSDESIQERIIVDGLTQAYGQKEHITINLNLKEFSLENPKLNNRKEERKDKEGKVIGTNYYYWITADYSMSTSFSVEKPDGSELIPESFISNSSRSQYKTKEYNTSSEASKAWTSELSNIKVRLIEDRLKDLASSVRSRVSYKIGYRKVSPNEYFWVTDSKKHPENDRFIGYVDQMKGEIARLTYEEMPENVISNLEPAIKYFESLTKLDIEDKQSKKLMYASAYNLALIHYILDQPLVSREWGNFITDNELDKREGKDFVENADGLNEIFKANNLFTTHFKREIPEPVQYAMVPTNQLVSEPTKKEEPEYLSGLVIDNEDNEIEGFFENDFVNKPWEVQDGVRFIPVDKFNNGNYSRKDVEKYSPKDLKGMAVENRLYIPLLFSDAGKLVGGNPLAATAKRRFIEVVKDGKYKILKFYEEPPSTQVFSGSVPQDPDPNDLEVYELILEPGEEKAVLVTTNNLEEFLEKNATVKSRYLKGEFSKDGKPIDTKRSILQKMDAKLDIDENVDWKAVIDALNS